MSYIKDRLPRGSLSVTALGLRALLLVRVVHPGTAGHDDGFSHRHVAGYLGWVLQEEDVVFGSKHFPEVRHLLVAGVHEIESIQVH